MNSGQLAGGILISSQTLKRSSSVNAESGQVVVESGSNDVRPEGRIEDQRELTRGTDTG